MLHKMPTSALSLSSLLLVVVLLPFLITVAIIGWFSVQMLEFQTRYNMQEDIELIGRSIQVPLSHAVQTKDSGMIRRILESAFSIDRVYGVYVYDNAGKVIYTSGTHDVVMEPDQAVQISATDESQSEFIEARDEQVFSFYVPLVRQGGTLNGLLQVTRRGRDFDRYLNRVRGFSYTVITISAVALAIIMMFGHRWVVGRHLKAIQADLQNIPRQNLSHRIRLRGPSELRVVIAGVNSMLDAVAQSHRELAVQKNREIELKEKLHRSEKLAALGQLAGGVAHELGSPLSVIDGQAQRSLRDSNLPQKVRAGLESIQAQSHRMADTIRQLLEYGRSMPPALRRVRATVPIESALNTLKHEALPEKELRYSFESQVGEMFVRVDPLRMEQALLNLLRNALREAAKRVSVCCSLSNGSVQYTVEDDGAGIEQNVVEHIFEPFFTTKPTGEGTGLGLSVAHSVAVEHGGSIQVDAHEAGRTRLSITIPVDGGHE